MTDHEAMTVLAVLVAATNGWDDFRRWVRYGQRVESIDTEVKGSQLGQPAEDDQ